MKLHLIMPMGGAGSRFSKDGFELPKPLLRLRGKPFFYWAVESVRLSAEPETITFVVLREHVERFNIDREILSLYPGAKIVVLPHVLAGAVLTALEGVKELSSDEAVLFNDCDHFFSSDALRDFVSAEQEADGALLTFESNEPKFSFVQCDEAGNVCRTAEKIVISNEAICGAYYFKSAGVFRTAAERYLKTCEYSEYYMSGVYNELIAAGGVVKTLPTDLHIPFGTPDEYDEAEKDERLEGFGL